MTTNYDLAAEQYARFEPPVIFTAQAYAAAVAMLERLTLSIEYYELRELRNIEYHSGGEPRIDGVRSDTPGEGRIED